MELTAAMRFAGAGLMLALLAACSATGNSVAPAVTGNIPMQPMAGAIPPNCCARQKTLFVVDAFGGSKSQGAVYMFDYETAKYLGQIAPPPEGWNEVQGACSDVRGNVYFANTNSSTVDEYAHAGTYLQTIADPGEYPVACSYDPANG